MNDRLGASGGDPGFEGRMSAVEAAISRIGPALDRLESGMRKLELDIAEIKGRVSQMPSTLTLIALAVLAAGGLMKHFSLMEPADGVR